MKMYRVTDEDYSYPIFAIEVFAKNPGDARAFALSAMLDASKSKAFTLDHLNNRKVDKVTLKTLCHGLIVEEVT